MCKLATKQGFDVAFHQGNLTMEAWYAFEENHRHTMHRGGATELPAALRSRLEHLVRQERAAILNISRNGVVIASLLLLTYKRAAFYFASGVSPEAYKAGFAAQLHWSAIEELRRRSYQFYDIGQYFPALENAKLKSLGDFKRMFGGTKRRMLAGELVVSKARMLCLDLAPAYLRQLFR